MKCSACGGVNPSKAKFCAQCGSELKHTIPQKSQPRKKSKVDHRRCEKCGNLVVASKKFCTACGTPLTIKTQAAKPVLSTHPAVNSGIQAKKKVKFTPVLTLFLVGIVCVWIFLQPVKPPDEAAKKASEEFGVDWEPPSFPVKTSGTKFDVIRIENKSSGNDLIVDYDGWTKGYREYGHANLHIDIIYKTDFEYMDVIWIAPDGQEFPGNHFQKRGGYDCISTSLATNAPGLYRLRVYAQVGGSNRLVHEETFQVKVVSGPRMIGPS